MLVTETEYAVCKTKSAASQLCGEQPHITKRTCVECVMQEVIQVTLNWQRLKEELLVVLLAGSMTHQHTLANLQEDITEAYVVFLFDHLTHTTKTQPATYVGACTVGLCKQQCLEHGCLQYV